MQTSKRLTLLEAREKKGWTQQKLEAESGVNQRNISKIERGEIRDPQNSTAEALERALGVERGTLIFAEAVTS